MGELNHKVLISEKQKEKISQKDEKANLAIVVLCQVHVLIKLAIAPFGTCMIGVVKVDVNARNI